MRSFSAATILSVHVLAPGAFAQGPGILHDPVPCVGADRYATVSARATDATAVARAEVEFRAAADGGWYAVGLARGGDSWSGVLPRPTPRTGRFEYRVVMTGTDGQRQETAPFGVRVEDPDRCPTRGSASIPSRIVVRVPPGAPVMPPVPPGFSPAGAVAFVPPAPKSRKTALIVGGGVVAGGIAAAAGGSGGAPRTFGTPEFTLFSTRPPAGATVSLRSFLTLEVLPSAHPAEPLSFTWRMEFASAGPSGCTVAMSGSIVGVAATVPVQLNGPLIRGNTCVPPIQASTGRFTVTIDGSIVHDETRDMPFTFVD
jgi:hypothetical protein